MSKKWVYKFSEKHSEGGKEHKNLLGGKGANLAEMCRLGLPVPAGFTISTEACQYYYSNNNQFPAGMLEQMDEGITFVEQTRGARLGDPVNPLLVSVRSGAAVSMPGMMDTVLNCGINDDVVGALIKKTNNPRFAWDSYRRFVDMFGDTVKGIPHHHFEEKIQDLKKRKNVKLDTELSADDLKELTLMYKSVYEKHLGQKFPTNPREQVIECIKAVFGSWMCDRAIKYREINRITGLFGTAVNVQSMAFGNMGETSGTGVLFTRDPSTGEKYLYGEYLVNAQGEDVVAGIRTPLPIKKLEEVDKVAYDQLVRACDTLEKNFKNMQDIEFTVQEHHLFMLQCRNGKRTGAAALRIAIEIVEKEKMCTEEEAIRNLIEPDHINQLLHPRFKSEKGYRDAGKVVAKGLAASPGAATGQAVFTAEEAEKWKNAGKKVMLLREETSPEDVTGMHVSAGVLTARGGMTSHAAVVARGWGKPCVAGCAALEIDLKTKIAKIAGKGVEIKEGDWISINGSTGEVIMGKEDMVPADIGGDFAKVMVWSDKIRRLKIHTNADTPADAQRARELGAEGIGLVRTEHMFFEEQRLIRMREMILASDAKSRAAALEKVLSYQEADFHGIFSAMDNCPVTVRLLDPPLHEFLPQEPEAIREVAKALNVTPQEVESRSKALHEMNPMLGHRGCRLGITHPEITEMQVKAIIGGAIKCKKEGKTPVPEIMVPLVGALAELDHQFAIIRRVAEETMIEKKCIIKYSLGTMIEVPRACLIADQLASRKPERAEFFSFGTNDLTQMTLGMSRDDADSFLRPYVNMGIYEFNPFETIDEVGVGALVRMACEKGRAANPHIHLGVCGEVGGDPRSINFFHKVGLDYVSCSPFRVPVARLAAAQAALMK